jgi:hypothetical protein
VKLNQLKAMAVVGLMALLAWAGSFYLRQLSGKRLFLGVCLLFAAVGVASSIILSLLQVKLMWTAAHM